MYMQYRSDPLIGELFAGYGGLGMGVQAALGGKVAWFSEFDAAPSKVLAHHWPTVPNHGDITLIDWSTVEPVDILTGGFPCQDVSLAGARRGLKDGTRSGLWSEFARAVDALRPGLVVIENVRGLLSAEATGVVESDPWGVGDGSARPTLRALGAVLGDLADLGYDTEWCGIRAADAGAPHGRYRVFIVAQDTDVAARRERGLAAPGQAERGRPRADVGGRGRAPVADARRGASKRRGVGVDVGGASPAGEGAGDQRERVRDTVGDRSAAATNTDDRRVDGRESEPVGGTLRRVAVAGSGAESVAYSDYPTHGWERSREESGDRSGIATPDADRGGLTGIRGFVPEGRDSHRRGGAHGTRFSTEPASPEIAWGDYEPAIRRWEHVTGRLAPSPTNPDGRGDVHRLSARFVEWMMGLPAGHVTDPDIGLTRNEQLKALGNGVVWQQAALALTMLTSAREAAA